MLKFFRLYNKYILGVGIVLLMIAFLIQPVMSIFLPDPRNTKVGTVYGETITAGQRSAGELEHRLLTNVGLGYLLPPNDESWFLMTKEAEGLGYYPGTAVLATLYSELGLDAAGLSRLAARYQVDQAFLDQTFAKFLAVQHLIALTRGDVYTNLGEPVDLGLRRVQASRLGLYYDYLSRRGDPNDFQNNIALMMQAQVFQTRALGRQRVSSPLIQTVLQQQRAQLTGEMVLVPASVMLEDIDAPTQDELLALFEAHKDQPAGVSEPYGFGYRLPQRVKLEVLTVDIDDVTDAIRPTIGQDEVQRFYEENPGRWADPLADNRQPGDPVMPRSLRDRVRDQLAAIRADDRAREVLARAEAVLYEDAKLLALDPDGYRVTDELSPTSLDEVAQRVFDNTGIRPRITDLSAQWIPLDQANGLPVIGNAHVEGQPDVGMRSYLGSTKAFLAEGQRGLPGLRLQVGLASRAMRDATGSRHLFRIADAETDQPPASMDVVRTQVENDARRAKAFQRLQDEQPMWTAAAVEGGLQAVANQAGPAVSVTPLTNIAMVDPQAGLGEPKPYPLPGVTGSGPVIDAVFTRARELEAMGQDSADDQARTVVVPLPGDTALAIVKIDEYRPLTRSSFEQLKRDEIAVFTVADTATPIDAASPIAMDRLSSRTGYSSD